MTYRVATEYESLEINGYDKALNYYEFVKESRMSEGVTADESYVELQRSEDGFEDYKVLKRATAVIDHDRIELRTPREEGFDWDYWAKWEEVSQGESGGTGE